MIKLCTGCTIGGSCMRNAPVGFGAPSTDAVCRIEVAPKLLELCAGAGAVYRCVTGKISDGTRHLVTSHYGGAEQLRDLAVRHGAPDARVQRQLRGDWFDVTDPAQEWFT